jgi:hypothetical protein
MTSVGQRLIIASPGPRIGGIVQCALANAQSLYASIMLVVVRNGLLHYQFYLTSASGCIDLP